MNSTRRERIKNGSGSCLTRRERGERPPSPPSILGRFPLTEPFGGGRVLLHANSSFQSHHLGLRIKHMISSILKIPYNGDSCENETFFGTFSCALLVPSGIAVRIGNRFGRSPRTTTINIKLVVMFCDDIGVV